MRKPLMALLIAVLLVLTVLGGLIPILQGWIFFVLALYLFATEFDTGRVWVKRARRRWPALSRWIAATRGHRWAPRQFREFDDLTDPSKSPKSSP
ncbi:MAG TPA: hypothetical protein VEC60_04920 [Reyranella sp.]|nr:hypothetical protein [Reyranella sp.]